MLNMGESSLKRREATELFQLENNPSSHELKKAYKNWALKNHPDKNPQNIEEKTRKMAKITKFYKIFPLPKTEEEGHIKYFSRRFCNIRW